MKIPYQYFCNRPHLNMINEVLFPMIFNKFSKKYKLSFSTESILLYSKMFNIPKCLIIYLFICSNFVAKESYKNNSNIHY